MLKWCVLLSMLAFVAPWSLVRAAALPNGATSLNESYHDWELSCQVKDDKSLCSVMQKAFDRKTRQRLYSIQFQVTRNQVRGVALLPFGLDLNRGMTLVTDGLPVGDIYPFATCMPEGCIVPLDLDDGQFEGLEKSKNSALSFTTLSGRTMKFPLSTSGLADALARAHTLTR